MKRAVLVLLLLIANAIVSTSKHKAPDALAPVKVAHASSLLPRPPNTLNACANL